MLSDFNNTIENSLVMKKTYSNFCGLMQAYWRQLKEINYGKLSTQRSLLSKSQGTGPALPGQL
jgi:hypothetical protein